MTQLTPVRSIVGPHHSWLTGVMACLAIVVSVLALVALRAAVHANRLAMEFADSQLATLERVEESELQAQETALAVQLLKEAFLSDAVEAEEVTIVQLLNRASNRLDEEFQGAPAVAFDLRIILGQQYLALDLPLAARAEFERAEVLIDELDGFPILAAEQVSIRLATVDRILQRKRFDETHPDTGRVTDLTPVVEITH